MEVGLRGGSVVIIDSCFDSFGFSVPLLRDTIMHRIAGESGWLACLSCGSVFSAYV